MVRTRNGAQVEKRDVSINSSCVQTVWNVHEGEGQKLRDRRETRGRHRKGKAAVDQEW